jgi:hypothetical protein
MGAFSSPHWVHLEKAGALSFQTFERLLFCALLEDISLCTAMVVAS